MTHYHLYIAAGSVIDETTKVYRVAIGTSIQANRDYLFLLAHAEAHNHYFHIIDPETQEFMFRVCRSVSGHTLSPVTVPARLLAKAFKSATEIPLSHGTLSNQHRSRHVLDTQYRVSCSLAVKS